ncbi:recombinase family protein [Bacillus sp. ISL-45]|uniref:recombinase family protein n=1 Tax=Bacillus sp. ISL-45 TaxID=2819128 RepID=UPI001BEB2503|nr:recombinase family protein [Bacillus sp. ISL-45]MBT2663887.1 recombinase family protein [Bacillus sp. ISL-45]
MGELIGYARVSTSEQDYALQVEHLEINGCTKIFYEKKSGKDTGRPELKKALEYLREGDKLVVYKIDRLARSTRDLQNIVHDLQEKGIGVAFIKEQIDFSTAAGKLMFTMLGAIAEFERDLINERTREGRERAKKLGKHLGRKGQDTKEIRRALKLFANREINGLSVNDIVKQTGVPRSTIYAKAKEINDKEMRPYAWGH